MSLNQVFLSSDYDRIALVVIRETRVDTGQILPDLEWSMGRVFAIEGPIGGKDEEQIAVVPGEVLMAEVIGVLVAETGPHCDVQILPHSDEEVVEQFGLPFADTHREVLVGVVILNGDVLQVRIGGGLGVVEVEQDIVDFHNHQELLASRRHHNYYNHISPTKTLYASLYILIHLGVEFSRFLMSCGNEYRQEIKRNFEAYRNRLQILFPNFFVKKLMLPPQIWVFQNLMQNISQKQYNFIVKGWPISIYVQEQYI